MAEKRDEFIFLADYGEYKKGEELKETEVGDPWDVRWNLVGNGILAWVPAEEE